MQLGELFNLQPPYWPSLTRTDRLSLSSIVRLPTTPGTTPEATGLPAGFSDLHTVWHVVLEGAHGSTFVGARPGDLGTHAVVENPGARYASRVVPGRSHLSLAASDRTCRQCFHMCR